MVEEKKWIKRGWWKENRKICDKGKKEERKEQVQWMKGNVKQKKDKKRWKKNEVEKKEIEKVKRMSKIEKMRPKKK